MRFTLIVLLSTVGLVPQAVSREEPGPDVNRPASDEKHEQNPSGYILGPGDQISVRAVDFEEINDRPVPIDTSGYVHLPMIGAIHAAGMSVVDLQAELAGRLKEYLKHPDVSVTVTTFKSQPVSVVGAVKMPGVYQVEGRKTVMEMLSLAGGPLETAAGTTLMISRRLETGRIPLKNARDDETGQFSVATLNLKSLLDARSPADNIQVQAHDVITVPRAGVVYVIGQVMKAGGFTLSEYENMTVLKALALAGGLDRTAKPSKAALLRQRPETANRAEISVNLQRPETADRAEIPVNIKSILDGKAEDVSMRPEDILFIPNSAAKKAAIRAAEAALQIGTGVVIFRR
jgi:polysaccharide export outer membrane protein